MCSAFSSVGVVEDIGGVVASVGAILAHEMGHLLTMQHDTSKKYFINWYRHIDYIFNCHTLLAFFYS